MRQLGRWLFPETAAEADEWRRTVRRFALNRDVLVVATTRVEGTWKAYCAGVPGYNHDNEMDEVLRHGSMVPERVARVLFPEFTDIPYSD